MKKIFILVILFFFISIVFAAEKKLLKASGNEIIIVGKITVHVNEKEFDFYAKSWGITDFSKPDKYIIFDDGFKEYTHLFLGKIQHTTNSAYHIFKSSDYFLSKRRLKRNELIANSPIKWCFYSNESFQVYIPLRFKAIIPKGEKYIYVGDFDYYLEGSDFLPVKISVSDNFDQAKEFLENTYKQPVNLCRVEIQNLD